MVQVSNVERNKSPSAATMALYRQNQIEMLAHGENMRAEQLQYSDFTADIFAIRCDIA